MKIFNTLSKQIEEFIPINPPEVKLFVCGPTVYDFAHIGNAKTYTQFDFIVRLFSASEKCNLFSQCVLSVRITSTT
jgi:cysteinyl-tRNA synthetase